MNELSICAIFKDETPYLKEWIEYHKLVGVEHFYLYDNENEDLDFLTVLQPYINAGEVTLIHWKDQDKDRWINQSCAWVYTTQVTAYEHAIWLSTKKTKWIACIDIDEFIVPVQENSILDILAKHEKHTPGIEVLWDIFGTSDIDVIPPNQLMIELMHKKSTEFIRPYSKKTILKPELYNGFFQPPHDCFYINELEAHEVSKNEMVINHYINRCNDYLINVKIKNKIRMANLTVTDDQIHNWIITGNDIEDEKKTIHKFIPLLKEKMGFIHG